MAPLAVSVLQRLPWEGSRVFLTGHTGFKGAWLALWLERLGASVTGYSLPPRRQSLYEAARLAGRYAETIADIRDRERLHAAMVAACPDIVFHLAAQPLVRAAYADPIGTYSTNVMGTAHVLEAARACQDLKALVVVTSDKVYRGEATARGFVEDDPIGGADGYSASKACAELVCASYRASFFAASNSAIIATARAGNVIGGGDWAEDRLVPDLVRAIISQRAAHVRAPEAVRPWQHVLDPLRGYLALGERLLAGEVAVGSSWNFGPEPADIASVRRVADLVTRYWGQGSWTHDSGAHPPETKVLLVDPTRAKRRLGWRSLLNLEDSVRLTVEWYRDVNAGTDALIKTNEQLTLYDGLSANAA